MMDERLLKMLSELSDVNSEINGILSVLDIVDAYYERKNNVEICEKILALSGWLKNVQSQLLDTMDKLDVYILKNKA